MSCQNPSGARGEGAQPAEPDPSLPREADRSTERAVLAFLLDEHPEQLTIPDVALAMNAKLGGGFEAGDAVERAIRDLVGAALLHCEGAHLVPTRAALYFHRLESD